MTPSQRLLRILREKYGLHVGDEPIHRTYAGHWQKLAGAWAWFTYAHESSGPQSQVGSQFGVTELLLIPDRLSVSLDEDRAIIVDPVDVAAWRHIMERRRRKASPLPLSDSSIGGVNKF